MAAYYNEIDDYAANWLLNLIAAGLIAPGDVDQRSILDVRPDDLRNYTQCHFFAGIGVWSYALRLAGWPDDRPVWTGSCPCQPFSMAGQGAGFGDERHLWPFWHFLIEQRQPPTVFGEQVEAAIKHGWLDLVQADMEGIGYAFASVGIPAAGIGAPHIRQRLFFVADSYDTRPQGWAGVSERTAECASRSRSLVGILADDDDRDGREERRKIQSFSQEHDVEHGGSTCCEHPGPTNGHWRDADWLHCRDGKWRPVEPGTFPLANGASARVGRLRAYGNAIVPQVAAEVIKAYLDSRP